MKIVIMAHGDQTRLRGLDRPKQLLELGNGETIVARTMRQAQRTWPLDDVRIVAPATDQWRYAAGSALYSLNYPGRSLLENITEIMLHVFPYDDLVFLLGDVVFSNEAMVTMSYKSSSDSLHFFGRRGGNAVTTKEYGEMFGVSVPTGSARLLFWKHLRRVQDNPALRQNLTEVLNSLEDVGSSLLVPIVDFTDDIDNEHDLKWVLPALQAAIAKEPKL